MKTLLTATILLLSASLTGCVTFPTAESSQVQVLWDNEQAINQCAHKGTVFGSEGHFYDFWLHADKNMVWGALNQMRIKAAKLDADTIYLYQPLGFLGSVTMIANAYDCNKQAKQTVTPVSSLAPVTTTAPTTPVTTPVTTPATTAESAQ